MKLSTKLILSFSCVIILLLFIGLVSQYFNNNIRNKVIDASRGAFQELEISGEMESHLYQSFIDAQYFLDAPYRATLDKSFQDSLLSVKNIKRKVGISLQGLNLNLKKIERLIKSENHAKFTSNDLTQKNLPVVAKLKNGIIFYNSLMRQLVNNKQRNPKNGTQSSGMAKNKGSTINQENFKNSKQLLTVTIEPYYRNNLLPLVDQFRNQIRTNLDDQITMLNDRLNTYSNILLAATILAFLFSLALAYKLYKSITIPMHSLANAAEEIGRGNLEKRIEVRSKDVMGQLGKAFNKMAENLNKITFSKEYIDDIIESMRDILIVTDEQLMITRVNSSALLILGYAKDDLVGQPLSKVFLKKNDQSIFSSDKHSIIENYETYFKGRGKASFPVNISKSIINGKDGTIQSIVYVASDITERKKSEKMIKDSLKEKETLLSEIHHRVKNNLAVISGLLQMQRWETDNYIAQEVLQDSQLRVKSIALVHEKLYQSENLSGIKFDQYVEELVLGINKTFKESATEIIFDIDIEPLTFSVNQAIPCSLLLNELIVNVHKHAFKNVQKGNVAIRLWKEGPNVHLIVKDDGTGLDEDLQKEAPDSLGMSLLFTLVEQLDGVLETSNDDGATFNIIFKLDE